MKAMPPSATTPGTRRGRAEQRLSDRPTKPKADQTYADSQRHLHELEVHQIELEMQNEELEIAREKLETLLEKYTDLYDFAPLGYLTLDHRGEIRDANLAGASLLGMARSVLVKQRFGSFVAPADRPVFEEFLQEVFASRPREDCELRLLVAGQPPADVRLRANVFESEPLCRVAVTDITANKQAEAGRLILDKLESTGILAGGIAHDFNNLITVVILNLELAQQPDLPAPDLVRHLEAAKQTALLARGLTAQLVTFAQGGAPLRRPTSLSGVIQESVRPALSGSKARCEFSLAEDLWLVQADAGQIGQVIRNLALNAREAMPAGGVIFVRAENVVLSAPEPPDLPAGEYVRISVVDQGSGIPPDQVAKIFDPYFSTKQRGKQKGMGLGLTICHAIVQKHGGAIIVKSELGVGTTFHFYLPADRNLVAETTAPARPGAPKKGKVLVMDDEEGVRKAIGLTLWAVGQEVEFAEKGETAIELYEKARSLGHPFDVVLLDLTIRGGMGGQETLRELLKLDPTAKAIAMSGYMQDPAMLDPDRHGFKGALEKPFGLGELREIISRVLNNSPRRQATP